MDFVSSSRALAVASESPMAAGAGEGSLEADTEVLRGSRSRSGSKPKGAGPSSGERSCDVVDQWRRRSRVTGIERREQR